MTRAATELIDISPLVSPRFAVWPGDAPFVREVSLDCAAGDPVTLSALRTSAHVGAHADAPCHVTAGGAGIAARPLGPYYGPCQVLTVHMPPRARVRPEHLGTPIVAPRVLIRTDSRPDPETFTPEFNALSAALVEHLHARGVVLIGIDTPSVDPFDDEDLESHHALARRDMASLENLALSHVAPGRYTLVALPLKLEGCDAAPVRAALVRD